MQGFFNKRNSFQKEHRRVSHQQVGSDVPLKYLNEGVIAEVTETQVFSFPSDCPKEQFIICSDYSHVVVIV